MPRSKNPNPRQVTDDEVNDELPGDELPNEDVVQQDAENIADIQDYENGDLSPSEVLVDPITDDWAIAVQEDLAADFASSSQLSEHMDQSENGSPDPEANPVGKRSGYSSAGKKPKAQSANVLNPQVMTWMRNRFEMGTGGKISASDVSNLYRKDTEHMRSPPPGLQNYQVGQLLRRVFPEITRCKITVNGRRYWVYKHLTLVKDPPEDLFEAKPKRAIAIRLETGSNGHRYQGFGQTDYDEGYAYGEDADSEVSKLSAAGAKFAVDKEKNNAILLGLLGSDQREPSPPEDAGSLQNGVGMGKKKRDSEVIDWLRSSYKFKPGYYVKSMDLLRKYNNGRVEIVKYLSQVGRVMKHVFPDVRHLRKSFKGGKREWVYLNLKPVDVDSDSEEGRNMVMPTMRRAIGWYHGIESPSLDTAKSSSGWKRERVDISHTPLSMVPSDSVFSQRSEVFQAKRFPNDNKVVITKKAYDEVPSLVHWSQRHSFEHEVAESGATDPGNEKDSSEIERDIFAPFTQCEPSSDSEYYRVAKRLKLSESHPTNNIPNASPGYSTAKTTNSREIRPTRPSSQPTSFVTDCNSPVLDLSIKGNERSSFREKIDRILSPNSPDGFRASDGQDSFFSRQSAGDGAAASPPAISATGVHPTIHYHPKNLSRPTAGYGATASESADSQSVSANQYAESGYGNDDNPISWRSLQTFNAQRYGWMKSPVAAAHSQLNTPDAKQPRYVEWFLFCGQALVDNQRALKEIKIYDDWTVEIHALGRRVYPNDLGGITDLEKTAASLNKVFRVLAESKMCAGFPAPSANDLYIHGILVSRSEVWSSRESDEEDLKQRAVNCQMMYSGPGICCSKCARIMKLHQQQRRSSPRGKRTNYESARQETQVKQERL